MRFLQSMGNKSVEIPREKLYLYIKECLEESRCHNLMPDMTHEQILYLASYISMQIGHERFLEETDKINKIVGEIQQKLNEKKHE